jgi:hypothetical protein
MLGPVVRFFREIGILHALAVLVLLIASTTVLINRGGSIVTLIAGSAASVGDEPILYITPHGTSSLTVGEVQKIDVRINTKTPINAVGATIAYTPETIEIVGISKEDSFLSLWTEETRINESTGEVHFSGGRLYSKIRRYSQLTEKAPRSQPFDAHLLSRFHNLPNLYHMLRIPRE